MVSTQEEISKCCDKLRSIRNTPFDLVPKELIEQIRPYANPPSYEEWLKWSPYFNKMPTYWNIALVDEEGKMMAFQYGTWDPCGAEMQIIRGIVLPKMYRVSGVVLKRMSSDVRKLAKELGMKRVYWITSRWKAFSRKLPKDTEVMEARVVEMLNV